MKISRVKNIYKNLTSTKVTEYNIPIPKPAKSDNFPKSLHVRYSAFVRISMKIVALIFLIAPSILHYNRTNEFSLIAIGIGIALALYMLYMLHTQERLTEFIANEEGIKSWNTKFTWNEVESVMDVSILFPSSRGPTHWLRIKLKSGKHHDYKLESIGDWNNEVPQIVQHYFHLHEKTVANTA